MAKVKESILLSWTLESNDEGQWALFARSGGTPVQMTTWHATKEQLLEVLKGRFQV